MITITKIFHGKMNFPRKSKQIDYNVGSLKGRLSPHQDGSDGAGPELFAVIVEQGTMSDLGMSEYAT